VPGGLASDRTGHVEGLICALSYHVLDWEETFFAWSVQFPAPGGNALPTALKERIL